VETVDSCRPRLPTLAGPATPYRHEKTLALRAIASRWGPAAAWALLLLLLGSRPPDALPHPPWLFEGADKLAHFGFYGVLGFLWARGRTGKGRAFIEGALVGALWGVLDEWIQSFVGRDADRLDLLADVLGASVGAWIGHRTFRAA